ncbi:MAG: hypothetical protein JWM02_2731 [Frankiales bacterium]|nr:hypothetical protein [Frankiales bacterium]
MERPAQELAIELAGWHEPEESDQGVRGNARLTALTGAVLLVLLAAEGVTLLRIHRLIELHVFLGLLLLPPVALKLCSTGYKILRYYTAARSYRDAGPPHPVRRALGPLVIVSTLAVLATGVSLLTVTPRSGHTLLFLHQASFIVWVSAMTLHVLIHLVRTFRGAARELEPAAVAQGSLWRLGLVSASLAVGAVLGVLSLSWGQPWFQRMVGG